MKGLIKVIYVVGLIFWSSFLAYATGKLILFNGLGNFYEFNCMNADSLQIEQMPNYLVIKYSYSANNKFFKKTEEVSKEFFGEKIGLAPSTLAICYNKVYPKLSYIKDANLALVQANTGIVISSSFLVLISLLYLFGKRDYWIQKYSRFFQKNMNGVSK